MHTALHLKYRPRTLDELAGQEYVQKTLINALLSGKIAQAYLFIGPRGTGKTSTARMFAKSLNCTASPKPTVHPCGECQSCRSIDKSTSLDVAEIDAASNNGVDDARSLIERSSFAPAVGRYRIFILDECHCLSVQAFNVLLKCIEEPPAHVVFILCTTEPHKVLPTITSRCQVFNFRALSISAIVEQLRFVAQKESIAIADEAVRAIARTADGGLRDALQLLDQLSLLEIEITKSHVIELSASVAESDLVAILQAIKIGNIFGLLQLSRSLLDNGKTPKLILSNLLTIYRDLLVVMASPKSQDLITGAISYSQLKQLATNWDYEAISAGLTQLQKSENQLRNAAQPHLWLEVCLLGLVLTRSEHSNNSNNGNGSKTALNSKRKSQPKVPTNNLTAIWNKVLESATPNNRSLLTHAELVELKSDFAVITVEAKYFHKFNCNAEKVEKMFQKATGARVTVSIKERRVK